jgi:hypothetical protein
MSISAISGSSSLYQPNQQTSQQQDLLTLTNTISSGDLSGAQQAYDSLTQAQAAGGNAPDPNSPRGQALAQIGKDLQSGDINGAQQTISALKSQGKGHAHGHHGHHHAAPPDQAASTTASPTSASTTTSSTTASSTNSLIDITA